MNLSKDARILNASGENIGNLNRFVLNPRTKEVSHLVFERGLLNKEEYVVSFADVQRIDEEGIHLKLAGDLKDLPPFQVTEYVATNERALLKGGVNVDTSVGSLYYYPGASAGMTGPIFSSDERLHQDVGPTIMRDGIPVTSEPAIREEIETNIPDHTVALKENARVISSDQEHVGDIEKVMIDPHSQRATHFLVTKGLLSREKKLLPIDWVDAILEDEVFLAVDQAVIDNLPEYKE